MCGKRLGVILSRLFFWIMSTQMTLIEQMTTVFDIILKKICKNQYHLCYLCANNEYICALFIKNRGYEKDMFFLFYN
jgi:hypothetical protein